MKSRPRMALRTSSLLAGIAVLACSPPIQLQATDRYFADLTITSNNGRYRLDAKSPDNEALRPGPFQSNFVYTLTEIPTGVTIWQRPQQGREGAPVDLFLSEDGWSAVCSANQNLICIDPHGNSRSLSLLEEALTVEERTNYVSYSTAGPRWTSGAMWYFSPDNEPPVFVIRPWWGRRIVVDLTTAQPLDVGKNQEQKLNDCRDERVLQTLEKFRGFSDSQFEEATYDDHRQLQAAILAAGQTGLQAAVPMLRELQRSGYSGSSTYSGGAPPGFEAYSTYNLRQLCQLSLRRLDQIPEALPCYEMSAAFPYPPQRHSMAGQITRGMMAREVVQLLGPPDFIDSHWSWDMDGDPPFSLTVHFDDEGQVEKVSRQRPPIWQSGIRRDRAIFLF